MKAVKALFKFLGMIVSVQITILQVIVIIYLTVVEQILRPRSTTSNLNNVQKQYWASLAQRSFFESRWAVYAVNGALILLVINIILFDSRYAWAVQIACILFLTAMLACFMHLFFVRVQASLMDGLLAMIVLGNVAGLVLTTPGIWTNPLMAAILGLGLSCWVMKALVLGAVKASLLDIRPGFARTSRIVLQLALALTPALFLIGLLLVLARHKSNGLQDLIAPHTQLWGWPLLIASMILFILSIIEERQTTRAARLLLEKEAALSKT